MNTYQKVPLYSDTINASLLENVFMRLNRQLQNREDLVVKNLLGTKKDGLEHIVLQDNEVVGGSFYLSNLLKIKDKSSEKDYHLSLIQVPRNTREKIFLNGDQLYGFISLVPNLNCFIGDNIYSVLDLKSSGVYLDDKRVMSSFYEPKKSYNKKYNIMAKRISQKI